MYSPGAVYDAVHKIAKRTGLSLRNLHGIRHSTGSWLVRAGVDLATVAAILRHSTPSTTLAVYTHVLEGAQADAVQHVQSVSPGIADMLAKGDSLRSPAKTVGTESGELVS